MAKVKMNFKKGWKFSKTLGKGGELKVSQRKSLFALESMSLSQDIYTQGCKQPTKDHYECVKPPWFSLINCKALSKTHYIMRKNFSHLEMDRQN